MPSAAEQSFSLEKGDFLGSFRIFERCASDPDGETYLAKNASRFATVLVRVFPADLSDDAAALEALEQRCEAVAAMQHPGIARCTSLLRDRGLAYVAMELPDGPRGNPISLAAALAETDGPFPEQRTTHLFRRLCEALEFAHQFRGGGLPHGRLSPECMYLTAQRQPRLVDFLVTRDANVSDDIRALGHLAVHVLTGKAPDPGMTTCPGGLSRRWERFVQRCLASGSPEGFDDIGAVREALEESDADKSGIWLWGGIVAALAALVAVSGFFFLRGQGDNGSETMENPVAKPAIRALSGTSVSARPSDSGDAKARRDVEKLRLQQGLAEVNAIKKRAEAAFEKTRNLPPGDGMAQRIDALKTLRTQAGNHLAGMKFAAAGAAYRELETQALALLDMDRRRRAAQQARQRAEEAREAAQLAHAETNAPALWRAAEGGWKQALADSEAQHFGAAATGFEKAARWFEEAAARSSGNRDLDEAKKAYAEEQRKDPDLLHQLDAETRRRIEALAAAGAAAEKTGDAAAAAKAYTTAATTLAAALDAAAAAGRGPILPPDKQFPRPASGNLVTNGDLERGADGQPLGWSRVDGLTTFWEKKGHPGYCLRFDTAVQQHDKRRLQENPEAFKGKTGGGQYSTVGAHEGVWAFAAPIPIVPEDRYFIIEADVMGPAKSTPLFYPQILIRGFRQYDEKTDKGTFSWFQTPHAGGPAFSEQFGKAQRRARAGDYLMIYRHAMVCRNTAANIWEHYRMAFKLPDEARFRPQVLLLKAYAMWPLGEYRFDNLVLRRATRREYDAVKAKGHSIRGFMPTE